MKEAKTIRFDLQEVRDLFEAAIQAVYGKEWRLVELVHRENGTVALVEKEAQP